MSRWSLEDRILFEEEGVIVVNKPAGLPSTGSTLEDPESLQFLLQKRYRRKIWAVHQLDRWTSGVNLFVRKKALVKEWSERLSRQGRKTYLTLVHGAVSPKRFKIQEPLGWVESRRGRWVSPEGQKAVTEVQVLESVPGVSLCRVRLHTGRTHQIRIHMAWRGHPLLGETRYAPVQGDKTPRQALHAASLAFKGGPVWEAPLPRDMRAWILAEGLQGTQVMG